ncbi:MAG: hypothetical protein ACRDF8_05065 [Chloroflexota bacterium]
MVVNTAAPWLAALPVEAFAVSLVMVASAWLLVACAVPPGLPLLPLDGGVVALGPGDVVGVLTPPVAATVPAATVAPLLPVCPTAVAGPVVALAVPLLLTVLVLVVLWVALVELVLVPPLAPDEVPEVPPLLLMPVVEAKPWADALPLVAEALLLLIVAAD